MQYLHSYITYIRNTIMENATDSIDDLLDCTLDDLEDLPEFKPFPVGAHRVSVTLELKKINEKQGAEFDMKAIETVELANTADTPLAEGDSTSSVYFLDNEFGRGALKAVSIPLAEALGTSTIRELIDACKGVECVVVTSLRKDKNDATKFYTNIKEMQVV